jgi:hypothetical protein
MEHLIGSLSPSARRHKKMLGRLVFLSLEIAWTVPKSSGLLLASSLCGGILNNM